MSSSSPPTFPMRKIGSLNVTMACLGTMTMGRQCIKTEAFKQLDAYVENSGNFIDTAEVYPVPQEMNTFGLTETIIGEWLASKPSSMRQKLVLATKVAGPAGSRGALLQREATLGAPPPPQDLEQRVTPAQIRRAVEASLKRLQTDYVDLLQIHWPDRPVPLWGLSQYTKYMHDGENKMQRAKDAKTKDQGAVELEQVIKTMNELIKEGKIKEYGLSNETSYGVMSYVHTAQRLGLRAPVSIQQDFSLCDRRYETELVECCSRNNIALLAYGPLCGGTLTGKYAEARDPKRSKTDWRHYTFPKFQARYLAAPTFEASTKYTALASEFHMTPVELALGWAATRWYMGSVIVGANTSEQLVENLKAVMVATTKITPQVEAKVDEIHLQRPNPNVTLMQE